MYSVYIHVHTRAEFCHILSARYSYYTFNAKHVRLTVTKTLFVHYSDTTISRFVMSFKLHVYICQTDNSRKNKRPHFNVKYGFSKINEKR